MLVSQYLIGRNANNTIIGIQQLIEIAPLFLRDKRAVEVVGSSALLEVKKRPQEFKNFKMYQRGLTTT